MIILLINFLEFASKTEKLLKSLRVLWRSAQNMGAIFIFTIGNRYTKQASYTHNSVK